VAESKNNHKAKKQPDDLSNVDNEIETLKEQINELINQLKIERADAINLRRRFEEEKSSLSTYYKTEIMKNFLPVIDNFERALKHTPQDLVDNPYIKGIDGIIKQFESVLTTLGVHKINSLNQTFDPNLHEAVEIDENSNGDKEVVSEELQAGYLLDTIVLRPALVKVKKQ
jgi:molecular chaperone GrpE